MLEQVLRRIADAIVANAPSDWTHGVLYSKAGSHSVSTWGRYTPPPDIWGGPMPHPFKDLRALAEALCPDRGWDAVSLEIQCRPSGEYRLLAFHDAVTRVSGGLSGFDVVLDPDYRLPQPGEHQESGTAIPAGDPELAATRFRAYLERRAEVLGHPEQLPPPATAEAIDEAERRLGRRLPADLRALYLIADGDGDRGLLNNRVWLSLKDLVAQSTEWGVAERPWFGRDLEWDAVVFDTTPADTVRRCGGHPGWLHFGSSEDGNYMAVDTAPARDGRPGQVIVTGRDHDDGPHYVADSVTSLLGDHLDLLDRGAYETRGDYIALLEPAAGSGPQEMIDGIPDEVPPTLQSIHINDADGAVDLAPLTAAHSLRRLHLNRSTVADLTPLRDMAVESLRVTLETGDLTPLAGHPHLTALDLATTAPTDLASLRTVPHLRGLDLSGADVPDLSVLADRTELRYLALTGRQWAALVDGGNVPPALAAARLADKDATLDEALALATRLGMDTTDALRVTGTLRATDR